MIRRLPAALAGLLTLAAGLVGLPAFLLTAAHQLAGLLPALADLPTALLAPGDGGLFLATLLGIGWLCWLVFVIAFVAEVLARIRGVRTPHMGRFIPQHTTAWAITAVVALLATLTPSLGNAGAATETVVAAASAAPASTVGLAAPEHQSSRSHQAGVGKHEESPLLEYRVKRGDTLWDVAEDKLDDPTAWPTIAQASRSIEQPDGRHLTDPDLILPGWTLHIPAADQPAPAKPAVDEPPAAADSSPDVGGGSTTRDLPALPGTPLRPTAPSSTPTSNDASTKRATKFPNLPGTPLRPPATPTPDGQLVASAGTTNRPTVPDAPLHQPAADSAERETKVAPALAVPGLPDWVCHPLTPAPLEHAPESTRSHVLAVLANQRGLVGPARQHP